jgi:menaquinone-9 beta-reductase
VQPALPIDIHGGGLAGLTLGIALRQRNVPVTIFEAGRYPRHRVCGEFISGHGLDVLRDLNLDSLFLEAGAVLARTASFHSPFVHGRPRALPRPALCLSRHVMDALLASRFQQLGGTLHQQHRVDPTVNAPGVVQATGRRPHLNRAGRRWIGLKVHAHDVPLDADLEMHIRRDGYVGLCKLGAGKVNVCGLFAVRGPLPTLASQWPELLVGPAPSPIQERLHRARFLDDTFRAVTGLNLRPATKTPDAACRVGDALTMIPPITGNGMSMAFESASWAVDPLLAYSRGSLPWNRARGEVAQRCRQGFARRLRWATWLQSILICPATRDIALILADQIDWIWRALYRQTR